MLRNLTISNALTMHVNRALQGQNHQRRATPCDWIVGPLQALKGRNPGQCLMSPLRGLHLRVFPFHRALPDANAKRLSALRIENQKIKNRYGTRI